MRKIFYTLILVGWLLGAVRNTCGADEKEPLTSGPKYIKVAVKRKPADRSWTLRDTRTIELLEGFRPDSSKVLRSDYGGRADKKAEARGFFYPKKIAGRWWLVDPGGNLFVNIGVCSVNGGRSKISQRPAKEKFGTWAKWAEFSTELLASHGFNGTGGWSDTDLLRSGLGFLDYARAAFQLPEDCIGNRYADVAHGCGLAVDYPLIWYPEDEEWGAYDGLFEENMVICVESYVGAVGGKEGVKLEQPIWITSSGPYLLSDYPLGDDWA